MFTVPFANRRTGAFALSAVLAVTSLVAVPWAANAGAPPPADCTAGMSSTDTETPATCTVPAGVTKMSFLVVGGGGGGGQDWTAGGGGGGEVVVCSDVTVTPGQVLRLVVGAGAPSAGAEEGGTADGNSGEPSDVVDDTSLSALCAAKSGDGGEQGGYGGDSGGDGVGGINYVNSDSDNLDYYVAGGGGGGAGMNGTDGTGSLLYDQPTSFCLGGDGGDGATVNDIAPNGLFADDTRTFGGGGGGGVWCTAPTAGTGADGGGSGLQTNGGYGGVGAWAANGSDGTGGGGGGGYLDDGYGTAGGSGYVEIQFEAAPTTPLTVVADDESVSFGASAPTYGYTLYDADNNEVTPSPALTTPPACSSTYSSSTGVSSSPVPITCKDASDTRYTFTYTAGAVTIGRATSTTTITCTGDHTYTAAAQTPCTAAVTGAGSLSTTTTVSYTDNTDVGTAHASASYTGDANHSGSTDTDTFGITEATPSCSITAYTYTYDTDSHTATGSCTGVGADGTLSGLDLSGTTHTDAGEYTDDWTFTDTSGNYSDDSGTVTDTIDKATPTCTVTPYSVTYDAFSHTATGSCSGVGSDGTLTGLGLSGTTHSGASTYSDDWAFTDSTGNYKDASGTVTDTIAKASSSTALTVSTDLVQQGGNITLSAALSPALCTGSPTFVFTPDPLGVNVSRSYTTSTIPTTGWSNVTYAVTAVYAESANCFGSSDDSGSVVVWASGPASYGSGTMSVGTNTAKFTFNVNQQTKTTPATWKGTLQWSLKNQWRFKGDLTTFGTTTVNGIKTGVTTGTGTMYWWDPTLNAGLGGWALAATGVAVTWYYQPTTKAGKNSLPGAARIVFGTIASANGNQGLLPNPAQYLPLKSGSIKL